MRAIPGLILLCLLSQATGASVADAPETIVRDYVSAYLGGDAAAGRDRMNPEMSAAMTPETASTLRARWHAELGDLREVGAPWLEDEVDGYRRYRVPVAFDARTLDLRVVLDAEDRIAGLFRLPHVPTPAERAAAPAPDPATVEATAGHWEGAIDVPGSSLVVMVDLVHRDGWWDGSADIPAQGLADLPLADVRVAADSVAFALSDIPGDPVFTGTLADGEIAGLFSQNGMTFPFRLARGTASPRRRPQDPRPPYPYLTEDVTYPNGDIRLAGTLTYPNAPGPFAAVLLISGSGPQNRDGEIFDHRPFLVLADHLTRRGLAVLRVDDRGVGASTGDRIAATSEDYCADALAGVRFLAAHPRIDPARIGLIGHSEGGIIAPMAAVRCDTVAFIVLLAGTGVPGDEILVRQTELISRGYGVPEAQVARAVESQRELMALLRDGADDATIRAQLLISARATAAPDVDDASLGAEVESEFAQITSPWFRFFLNHDPRPVLKQVEVPVLALCGEKDRQVDPAQSLPEIDRALSVGGNPDVTVWEMPGLNHLFQTAETGSPGEYWEIEETMAPAVLEAVVDWIGARVGD